VVDFSIDQGLIADPGIFFTLAVTCCDYSFRFWYSMLAGCRWEDGGSIEIAGNVFRGGWRVPVWHPPKS
jgi:hypothetical protein